MRCICEGCACPEVEFRCQLSSHLAMDCEQALSMGDATIGRSRANSRFTRSLKRVLLTEHKLAERECFRAACLRELLVPSTNSSGRCSCRRRRGSCHNSTGAGKCSKPLLIHMQIAQIQRPTHRPPVATVVVTAVAAYTESIHTTLHACDGRTHVSRK